MIRIIISDEFGQHGLDIQNAIIAGYGSDISDQTEIISGWEDSLTRATSDTDIIALIRSTGNISGYLNDALNIYPRVQCFFPLGSNYFAPLYTFFDQEPPISVIAGAGIDKNETGYGNGLEFWDYDLGLTPGEYHSSFANGVILGKVLYIKDQLSCSWWEARLRARKTAFRNEPNRNGYPWDFRNGFGKINILAALNYVGILIEDPYLNPIARNLYEYTERINVLEDRLDNIAVRFNESKDAYMSLQYHNQLSMIREAKINELKLIVAGIKNNINTLISQN